MPNMAHPTDLAVDHWALGLILLNVLLDQIGLPVPAAPALIFAGSIATAWGLGSAELLCGAIALCVVSDVGWFMAGRRFGGRIMRLLCRISISPDSCVRDTQLRFARWGGKVLLVSKFVPGISLISSPLAGALRMTWSTFLTFSVLGSALWVGTLFTLGALLAPQIDALLPHLAAARGRVALVVGLLLALYILVKLWQRWRLLATLRMARITVVELHGLIQADRGPLVLDVRSHTALAVEPRSIPNALHAPPEEIAERLHGVDRDRDVVLYCTCPNEASAARAARLLMRNGFRRVRPLLGGLDAWVDAGYPVADAQRAQLAVGVLADHLSAPPAP
jgi:membrane protein DedA with SNARE-associated domain/rhodanese-related sulfurtransferase